MPFHRKSADLTPLADISFATAARARQDREVNGDLVVQASIGTLCDDQQKIIAFPSVYEHFDAMDARTKASYAQSFTGNPSFRKAVTDWVLEDHVHSLHHSVIATPGGTGALWASMNTFLDPGETVILPKTAWNSYAAMADHNSLQVCTYDMFADDHFNPGSLQQAMSAVSQVQDRIVFLINTPCNNPTGYSLSDEEWETLIGLVNRMAKTCPVVMIIDIAYFDYVNDPRARSSFCRHLDEISDRVMVNILFSISKTMTAYGLRCGASILLAKHQEDVRQIEIILEKTARLTWSNVNNAAMECFAWAVSENRNQLKKEIQDGVRLLKERSDIFLKEAADCGLELYPYREGFFCTLKYEDPSFAAAMFRALMDNHIYTVKVTGGIRIALCSLPARQARGLAARIRDVQDQLKAE